MEILAFTSMVLLPVLTAAYFKIMILKKQLALNSNEIGVPRKAYPEDYGRLFEKTYYVNRITMEDGSIYFDPRITYKTIRSGTVTTLSFSLADPLKGKEGLSVEEKWDRFKMGLSQTQKEAELRCIEYLNKKKSQTIADTETVLISNKNKSC